MTTANAFNGLAPNWASLRSGKLPAVQIPPAAELLGAKLLGLDQIRLWLDAQRETLGTVQHNVRVGKDMLTLSRLPEMNPAVMKRRLQKLDTVLAKIDGMLRHMERLLKLLPPESTLQNIIEQLTRSQTTIAIVLGVFVGWFTTFSWYQRRSSPETSPLKESTKLTDKPPTPKALTDKKPPPN
jgi:hypothetical protein